MLVAQVNEHDESPSFYQSLRLENKHDLTIEHFHCSPGFSTCGKMGETDDCIDAWIARARKKKSLRNRKRLNGSIVCAHVYLWDFICAVLQVCFETGDIKTNVTTRNRITWRPDRMTVMLRWAGSRLVIKKGNWARLGKNNDAWLPVDASLDFLTILLTSYIKRPLRID